MRAPVFSVLASLALVACFNPDDETPATGSDTDATTGTSMATSDPTTDTPTTTSNPTTGVDSMTSTTDGPTTEGPTTTDAETGTADTGSSSSTGEPLPIECGDGIPAPGEVCFDDAAVLNAGDIGYSPRVGEVNGDGNVDLLYMYGDQIVVRLGDGTGMFGPELPDETLFCSQMELADVDGDDVLDHVCVSADDPSLQVSLGNGSGSFNLLADSLTVGNGPVEIVAGPLNGDGSDDVATIHADAAGGTNVVRVNLAQGGGAFSISDSISTGNLPGADIAMGDFTGDGVNDLVFSVAMGSNQVRIAVNDGDGGFGQSLQVNTTTSGAFGVAAGDFNGDEDDDIAIANGDDVLALLGTGTASFETAVSLDTIGGSIAYRVAVDDVTNDDLADIIVVYSNQATVSVFPSAGDGTFGERVDLMVGVPSNSLSTGDVNADGVPDIVIGSTSDELITVLISTP